MLLISQPKPNKKQRIQIERKTGAKIRLMGNSVNKTFMLYDMPWVDDCHNYSCMFHWKHFCLWTLNLAFVWASLNAELHHLTSMQCILLNKYTSIHTGQQMSFALDSFLSSLILRGIHIKPCTLRFKKIKSKVTRAVYRN